MSALLNTYELAKNGEAVESTLTANQQNALSLGYQPRTVVDDVAENIPDELKAYKQFIGWQYQQNDKDKLKPLKVPLRYSNGRFSNGNAMDASTYLSSDEALQLYKNHSEIDGIGFCLTESDPFTFVDFDGCIKDQLDVQDWANDIINDLDTWTEYSPSGKGFHAIVKADVSGMKCKSKNLHNSKLELYKSGRFFTITGRRLIDKPLTIADAQEAIQALSDKMQSTPTPTPSSQPAQPRAANNAPCDVQSVLDLIEAIHRKNNGQGEKQFLDLHYGGFTDGVDKSGYDLAYMNKLAFYTGGDAALMDAAYRQSALIRDKSNRPDYVQRTIQKAIDDCTAFYDPDYGKTTIQDFNHFQTEHPPVDLFNNLKLPPFPLELLPSVIADYAKDQAELIGVDPAVIALAAIGAAAACIDDRLEIQPKRHDTGWREQARLWVGIIGDPSAKKSPGISKAMRPLFGIDKKWREETSKALAEWSEACEKAGKDGEKPERPIEKRLIINDATVEKMGDIMSKSEPRGILSYQDELSGWLASMDAYKNVGGKDKAAWLEAYNGGPKAIDRINRGSTFVDNWSASVIGGIQPSVIQSYAHTSNHDGMLQRFILVQAGVAPLGTDRPPNVFAQVSYDNMMNHLSQIVAEGHHPVKLSSEAHKIREELEAKIHKIIKCHPNKFLAAALGKWSGLFARLLLTFHCIEAGTASKHPTAFEVSGDTAQKVAALMRETLLPHAISFYNGLDPVEDTALELARLILAKSWARFTVKRDLNREWKASRKLKPWELDETLDRLEAFSWIYPEAGQLNEKGRPSAYKVNPNIHKAFEEQAGTERERRKEVTAMMAELKQVS